MSLLLFVLPFLAPARCLLYAKETDIMRLFRLALISGILVMIFAFTSPAKAALRCPFLSQGEPALCLAEESPSPAAVNEEETFGPPPAFDDSVFGRVYYGRLADYTIVYPEPSRAAPPVRNVGDGYLFATVMSWSKIDGATWYQINYGEYVHEDDIRLVEPSGFQGVQVLQQPQRPFGWVVQDVQPSSEPDGEPDPAFPELSRYMFVEIFDVVQGEEDWLWYDIGDGRWVRQTYFSIVDVSPRPAEVGPGEFWTEVDLYEQTFAAYEGDRMVYASLISSGLNRWPTYEGIFQVWQRFEKYKMSGAKGKVDYYYLEDVPYIMYFDPLNGIGLHGTFWHDRFGYKHSHGCVNMTILDAEWTFKWSEDAPNDLWVWVHTSDPATHLEALSGL
jgi:hypothetical protein